MQQKISLKNRALYYLARREHSRLELARKLARYAEEQDEVEILLDFLENAGFLSSERFTEALVRRRSPAYGNSRILAELHSHGVDPQLMAQTKTELAESEAARARIVWQKKFGLQEGLNQSTPEQRVKQFQFLARRGFSSNAIRAVLRGVLEE